MGRGVTGACYLQRKAALGEEDDADSLAGVPYAMAPAVQDLLGNKVSKVVLKPRAADSFLLADDEVRDLVWTALAECKADPTKAVCAADEDGTLFTEVRRSILLVYMMTP